MLSFGIFNNKKSILITLYIIKINIIKVILRTVIDCTFLNSSSKT
jgi:hypothetical protein